MKVEDGCADKEDIVSPSRYYWVRFYDSVTVILKEFEKFSTGFRNTVALVYRRVPDESVVLAWCISAVDGFMILCPEVASADLAALSDEIILSEEWDVELVLMHTHQWNVLQPIEVENGSLRRKNCWLPTLLAHPNRAPRPARASSSFFFSSSAGFFSSFFPSAGADPEADDAG